MQRKVVRHGPSTLIISLPTQWVKRFGVAPGSTVEVEDKGKSLMVSAGAGRRHYFITADVSGLAPRLVDRFLARSYQKGYDKMTLVHNSLELLEAIQKKVHELIGYEIIEQNETSCVLQSVSSNIELDFDNSLRKAFLTVKEMIEQCNQRYEEKAWDALANLHLKDLQVNRFCYFCLRQLNKEQYLSPNVAQTYVLYYLIEILEDLGDNCKKLAQQLAANKTSKKPLQKILKKIAETYDVSYSFFYNATEEKANKAFQGYKEIDILIEEMSSTKLSSDEVLSLIHMHHINHIIYHYTTMRLDFLKGSKVEEEII